jgi:hypothetical protein
MNYLTLPSGYWPDRASFPPNSIFVFDFDGVLICQNEEKVYQLDEIEGERDRLEELALRVGIDPTLYSTSYLRHLVFQSRYDQVCKPHVLAEFARDLDVPYFVLTLRSGRHALHRMLGFLDVMHIYPQELFCVGRGLKSAILTKLLEEWPDRHLVFFDDSMRHIEDACSIESNRLTVVYVEWPTCKEEANYLRNRHIMSDVDERLAFLRRLQPMIQEGGVIFKHPLDTEFLGALGPQ